MWFIQKFFVSIYLQASQNSQKNKKSLPDSSRAVSMMLFFSTSDMKFYKEYLKINSAIPISFSLPKARIQSTGFIRCIGLWIFRCSQNLRDNRQYSDWQFEITTQRPSKTFRFNPASSWRCFIISQSLKKQSRIISAYFRSIICRGNCSF